MQHKLFKIFSRKFVWRTSDVISGDRSKTIECITGKTSKRLKAYDFFQIAFYMDIHNISSIRFITIDDELYLDIEKK